MLVCWWLGFWPLTSNLTAGGITDMLYVVFTPTRAELQRHILDAVEDILNWIDDPNAIMMVNLRRRDMKALMSMLVRTVH